MADYKKAGIGAIIGIISVAVVVGISDSLNLSGLTSTLIGFVPVSLAAKMIYDAFA